MDGEQDDHETVEAPAPAVRAAPVPARRSMARPAVPAATAAARAVFGERLALATRYAELLVGAGTERGVIGPRETERIWDRHLVNCALVTELLPADARLVDVGSGAGLPGLAAAIRASHLTVNLVEPQERRCQFLREAVAALELAERVRVIRGRADEKAVRSAVGDADWVTARAVAPLDQLVRWCLPLLRPGGSLLALKGRTAASEIDRCAASIARAGGTQPRVRAVESAAGDEVLTVVVVQRRTGDAADSSADPTRSGRRTRAKGRR